MKTFNYLFLSLCLLAVTILKAQEASDDWVGHWMNGIELSREENNYPKAIETYTTAIQATTPNQMAVQLNLINERGNLYFQMLDFTNAIKDFSYVIHQPRASRAQMIEALWGRSKAYLASGKIQEFEKDSRQLEALQPFFEPVAETQDYAILKVDPKLIRNAKSEESFIKMLLMRKEIKSEKDVTFTPSGLIIVKKAKSK